MVTGLFINCLLYTSDAADDTPCVDLGDPYDDIARDEFGKDSINFGIYGIPESILIDKDLVIIKKFIGPISKDDYNFIKQIIRKQ